MKIELSQEQLHLIQLALCFYELDFQQRIESISNKTGINTSKIAEHQKTQDACNDLFFYILKNCENM